MKGNEREERAGRLGTATGGERRGVRRAKDFREGKEEKEGRWMVGAKIC